MSRPHSLPWELSRFPLTRVPSLAKSGKTSTFPDMEIRSVTLFCDPDFDSEITSRFYAAARTAFTYPVQTVRLATPPFPDWWAANVPVASAADFAARWQAAGADYISLGPVRLGHAADWLDHIPDLRAVTDVLFATIEIADGNGRIDLNRIHHTAQIIQQVSVIQPNGFGNLYLSALANCPPGSPFFPVAYHAGGPPRFAIAVEAADLALNAIQSAQTLEEARTNLVTAIEEAAEELVDTAVTLANIFHIPFHGLDFSLAPYPTDAQSLAGAMEALGVPHVGAPGSLFAAAFITEAIGRANFPRCGFSGLMLPVLEDSVLALRAGEGKITVNDLLGYAAICGVGLDTIPLPGDIAAASLSGILLDVAALASRLDKPLTARLMPLPGLQAGDPVQFDFPYFADSGVMAVPGGGVSGTLQGNERLTMRRFHQPQDVVDETAVLLANFIQSLPDFTMTEPTYTHYDHMGAVITEGILQAGIKYETVVRSRVENLRQTWPQARTTSAFQALMQQEGLATLINWQGQRKLNTIQTLTQLFVDESVETEADLRDWLGIIANRERLAQINGIGPKTIDYLQLLVGIPTIAVDVHLFRFLEMAGLPTRDYDQAHQLFTQTAAVLGWETAVLDHSIWQYMSQRVR